MLPSLHHNKEKLARPNELRNFLCINDRIVQWRTYPISIRTLVYVKQGMFIFAAAEYRTTHPNWFFYEFIGVESDDAVIQKYVAIINEIDAPYP